MTQKPDDATWQEYIFDHSGGQDEIETRRTEFSEYLVGEVREGLRESDELEESDFALDDGDDRWVRLEADGWMMDTVEDVVRVRDALRAVDVGDESVGVYAYPYSAEDRGPLPDLPPIKDEYAVQVQLHREVEVFEEAVGQASEKVDEKMGENLDV